MYAVPQSNSLMNLDSENHGYMVFGNTGMDDKALFMQAAQGVDVISQMYPNLRLQNLDSENHGYMVFGNTGMDDKALFMQAAQGVDVISQMYPNLRLQNLAGRSPMITKEQASKLPSFNGAIATKTKTGIWN